MKWKAESKFYNMTLCMHVSPPDTLSQLFNAACMQNLAFFACNIKKLGERPGRLVQDHLVETLAS